MARRINTKFVMGLGIVLFVIGLGTVALVSGSAQRFLNHFVPVDPAKLAKEGDEFEAKKDLVNAVLCYEKAANASSLSHRPGTDKLYDKLGDLSMELSAQLTDPIESSKRYGNAQTAWRRALTENASYIPAREKLIEEQYKVAMYNQSSENWSALEETASKLTVMAPAYGKAFTYLAAARLAQLTAPSGLPLNFAQMKNVDETIQRAMKEDPKSATPYVLRADLLEMEAQRIQPPNVVESQKYLEAAVAGLVSFWKDNPNDPDAAVKLATLYWTLRKPEESIKVLEAAVAAHPSHVHAASLLATIYGEQHSLDKAEKVMKDLVAANPTDAESYMALAHYYQSAHQPVEAIDAFSKAMAYPQAGGGIAAALNIRTEVEALFSISWLYMDIAEDKSRAQLPAEFKSAMDQARVYADKHRASHSLQQAQDLLQGRLQLLSGNTREAIAALTRADAVYGKNANSPQWLQTKAVLSQAFEIDTQWGTALRYLNEILQQFPQMPTVILQKARVLVRIAQFNDALLLVSKFAEPPADAHVPAELQEAALKVEADAYRGLGMADKAEHIQWKMGGIEGVLAIASSRLRDNDLEGALQEANAALKLKPDYEKALVLALVINVRLEKNDEAKAILDKAIGLYPKNSQLQVIKVLLSNPKGDPQKMQEEALHAIVDPFTQHMALAAFYGQLHERDKQIAEIEKGLEILETNAGAPSKEAVSQLSDQVFSLNLAGAEESRFLSNAAQKRADAAKAPADKSAALAEKKTADEAYQKYWSATEKYVQKAQRLNLDGVGGKLYLGRFDFSAGGELRKTGIQTLEEAVQERPNNSICRTVLGQAYYMDRTPTNGNADKALEQFREAIQQKPDNMTALKFAIDLLIRKLTPQSQAEARDDLSRALAFAPRDRQLLIYSDQLNDPAESIRKRTQTMKENPDDLDNIRSLAILYVSPQINNPLKGVELLRIIQAKYPKDLVLADTIAHLLHEGHKDNDALQQYEPFIIDPDPQVVFRATLMLGDLYRVLDRPEQAITIYKGAISKQVNTDEAQKRLADLYFDIDDMKDAEAMYREIYNQGDKKEVTVLRRLVESMLRQDKFADADVLINTLLKEQPDDPDGWILRGFGLLRQHKPTEAIACFDHVLKVHPENLDALHYRAFTAFSSGGDLKQATADLLAVREADPYRVNSRILLAKVLRMTHNFAESADEYEAVIRLQPDVPAYRVEYAEYLLAVADVMKKLSPDNEEDLASGVRVVRPAERLAALLQSSAGRFPEQPIWLILEGRLLFLQDKPVDAAQKYLEGFEKSDESPQIGSIYLAALLSQGNYEKVIAVVTQLLEKQPKYGDYYIKRGTAYGKIKKYPEAMADFAQALTLTGNDLDAYLSVVRQAEAPVPLDILAAYLSDKLKANGDDVGSRIGLADIDLNSKKGAEAVQILTPLVADPQKVYHTLVLRMMGIGKLMAGDPKGSEAAYLEVLKITPNDIEVINNLAYLLAEDLHRPKDALKYAEKAVQLMQAGKIDLAFINNGNVYDTYGWVKFLNGDATGALTELRRAQQIEPSPIIYLHLAKVLKASDIAATRRALADGIKLATQAKDPLLEQLQTMSKEVGVE